MSANTQENNLGLAIQGHCTSEDNTLKFYSELSNGEYSRESDTSVVLMRLNLEEKIELGNTLSSITKCNFNFG